MASLRSLGMLLAPARASSNGATMESDAENSGNGRSAHKDDWAELRLEIARSRRFGRAFGLIRIDGVKSGSLGQALRNIDREWRVNGTIYLLLPETHREAAQSLLGRLRREASEELAGCSVSVAAFPEDGLTSGALLKALRPTKEPVHQPEARPAFAGHPDSTAVHA
jgi:hypothetical protein